MALPPQKRTGRFRCVLALTPVICGERESASPVCYADEFEMQTQLFDGVWRAVDDLYPHETLTSSSIALLGLARSGESGDVHGIEAAENDLELASGRRKRRVERKEGEETAGKVLTFKSGAPSGPVITGLAAGSECVGFRDLRFDTPGRDAVPFRFVVCRDSPDAPWARGRR